MVKSERSVRELRRLYFLSQIAESVCTIEDLQGILDVLQNSLKEIIPSDYIYFFLHEQDQQLFRLPARFNKLKPHTDAIDDFTLHYPDTKLSSLLSTRQPIVRSQKDSRLLYTSEELAIWGEDIAVDMSAPILGHSGRLIGVLNFARRSSQNFNRFQRSLAMTTAALLGKVVERDYYMAKVSEQRQLNSWWEDSFRIILENSAQPTALLDLSDDLLLAPNTLFHKTFSLPDSVDNSACISSVLGDAFLASIRRTSIPNSGTSIVHTKTNGKKYRLRLLPLGTESRFVLVSVARYANKKRQHRDLLEWSAKLTDIVSRIQIPENGDSTHAIFESIVDELGQLLESQFVTFCSLQKNKINLEYSKSFLNEVEPSLFHHLLENICRNTCKNLSELPESRLVHVDDQSDLFARITPALKQLNIVNILAIPIHGEGVKLGVITFYFNKSVSFSSYKMKILRNAVQQLTFLQYQHTLQKVGSTK